MVIKNQTKNTTIASKVVIADTFLSRMVGLLNRDSFSENEALVITRCQSIHMFFMRFCIDVIFVSKEHRVVGLAPHIKPFQLSPVFFKSSYAVELQAGTISKTQTSIGDELEIQK